MSLFTVDIKQVLWWHISDLDTRTKYRAIERSFITKFGKCIDNLSYFASLSDKMSIRFTGEIIRHKRYKHGSIDTIYDGLYAKSFWYDVSTLATLVKNDPIVEKHIYRLIDLVKNTLSKIKLLLGDTNEEIEKQYYDAGRPHLFDYR